jgi:Flp pilus assembly protein TadG
VTDFLSQNSAVMFGVIVTVLVVVILIILAVIILVIQKRRIQRLALHPYLQAATTEDTNQIALDDAPDSTYYSDIAKPGDGQGTNAPAGTSAGEAGTPTTVGTPDPNVATAV